MPSEDNPPAQPKQQKTLDLPNQSGNDARRNTLRDVQEHLKRMSSAVGEQLWVEKEPAEKEKDWKSTIEDLRLGNWRLLKSMETLSAENEDLKITLKQKEELIEEKLEKIGVLEKDLQNQQQANLHLIQINSGVVEELKKRNEEIENSSMKNLEKTETMKSENEELMNSLKKKEEMLEEQMKEKERFEKTVNSLYEENSRLTESKKKLMRKLKNDNDKKLKKENDLQLKKLMDLEESLKEYQGEVCRLRKSNNETVACCENWVDKWQILIERFESILKKEDENREEASWLEEKLKLANDEMCWWFEYRWFNLSISNAFHAGDKEQSGYGWVDH